MSNARVSNSLRQITTRLKVPTSLRANLHAQAALQAHAKATRLPLHNTLRHATLPHAQTFAQQGSTRAPLQSAAHQRTFRTTAITMSSDADYAAFLDKANQDTGSATAQSKSVGTKAVNTEVPKVLDNVQEYYTSDADEPFEPVALSFEGKEIFADQLKELLEHKAPVEDISEKDFDPRGQYKSVVDAVKKAGDGRVKVFKVEHGGTRTEYYVVSVDGQGKKLVGLKALAVES